MCQHELTACACSPTQELADVVFAEALEEYVELELAWLQQLYETRAPAAPGALSLQMVTDFFAWNREVQRVESA